MLILKKDLQANHNVNQNENLLSIGIEKKRVFIELILPNSKKVLVEAVTKIVNNKIP